MKTEMAMLPNGNYESVICYIQHECVEQGFRCVQYAQKMNKLLLSTAYGDPYEDGYSIEILVKYCPFCGYSVDKN